MTWCVNSYWCRVHLCTHSQTCRWQMASEDVCGESGTLAELTLNISGRLGSRSEPTVPCRESEGRTSFLRGLRKFNYSLMKSELTSPIPPLMQLELIMNCSWAGKTGLIETCGASVRRVSVSLPYSCHYPSQLSPSSLSFHWALQPVKSDFKTAFSDLSRRINTTISYKELFY